MIIKVCGIKTEENISFLNETEIDMIGLNFYLPSVRYISNDIDPSIFEKLNPTIKKVGVFVNETEHLINDTSQKFSLDYVQLHGDEDSDFCNSVAAHIPVIKVFRVDDKFDLSTLDDFSSASYYLFDTQTKNYGGSGKKFDWEKLSQYDNEKPFLLSGGIGPSDYDNILQMDHPQFTGIDINSKFESAPGIKDQELVLPFVGRLRGAKKNS